MLPDAAPVLIAGADVEAGGVLVLVLPELEPLPEDPLPLELVLLEELEPELELPGAELEVAFLARAAKASIVFEPFRGLRRVRTLRS